MKRKRMRAFVTIVIVLALMSGGTVTLIAALHGTTVTGPINMLPGMTLTPQDFTEAGLGTAVSVGYADQTFVFFPDQSTNGQGKELATAKNGITVDFRDGGSLTLLGGQFASDPNHVLRNQAYAWYKDKLAANGLINDTGTAIVGEASARYDDPAIAAMLVRKNDTVFTIVYKLGTAATSTAPRPIIALEALARLLASRL
ncbi:MAG TPA: hypothetical protein VFB98_01585 [Candidatus Deferrimicrobium sp.]|nr:hypothetical protein [Candidatus Deferrimicrobium sp.]